MEFKDKCKSVRQTMLMSQEDFAKELGVDYCTVNRWENGKSKPYYKAQRLFRELCQKNGIEFKE